VVGTISYETFHSPKIVGLEKPEKAQTPYSDKRCLNSVFSSTARSVGQQIKYTHPVEIKSGASGRLKSLHLLLETYPNCPSGYVFSTMPYSELPKQKLIFLPLYYAYTIIHLNSAMKP